MGLIESVIQEPLTKEIRHIFEHGQVGRTGEKIAVHGDGESPQSFVQLFGSGGAGFVAAQGMGDLAQHGVKRPQQRSPDEQPSERARLGLQTDRRGGLRQVGAKIGPFLGETVLRDLGNGFEKPREIGLQGLAQDGNRLFHNQVRSGSFGGHEEVNLVVGRVAGDSFSAS